METGGIVSVSPTQVVDLDIYLSIPSPDLPMPSKV